MTPHSPNTQPSTSDTAPSPARVGGDSPLPPPPPALQAEGLSIGYRPHRRPPVIVARDLQLRLEPGFVTCLLGPNGAGKSTLLRTIAGMQAPLAGSLCLGGDDVTTLDAAGLARRRAVVLTERLDIGNLTVYELVSLGRHPHTGWFGGLDKRDRQVIDRALAWVGAAAFRDRQASELSDGERQRVMIARALAQEARLVILDEPTAFLDLPHRVHIMHLLWRLAREAGAAILLSTHDLDLALRCADQLWLLPGDGRVLHGAPEDLVLAGAFSAAFPSDDLQFDAIAGVFRMHHDHRSRIFAQILAASEFGDSIGGQYEGNADYRLLAEWTRRALERVGIETADTVMTDNDPIIIVHLTSPSPSWTLRWRGMDGAGHSTHASLASLVQTIERLRVPARPGKG